MAITTFQYLIGWLEILIILMVFFNTLPAVDVPGKFSTNNHFMYQFWLVSLLLLIKWILQAVNWLRKQYAKNSPSILADEAGLGKTASIVTSLESFRLEFKAHKPALIVVPQTSLAFWEGELEFWAHENCNTVSFAGTNAAKTLIHDNELWLQPGSLDDRTSYNNFQSAPPKASQNSPKISPQVHIFIIIT